jgi:glyoxylase-like metal-dependent hydrolase (beta-lactamase superfamily II)
MPAKLSVLSIQPSDAPFTMHPVLLHDDTHAVLADAGLPGMLPQIAQAMEAVGVPLSRLTHIVITHADMDHVGSLAALAKACPGAQILCHEKEKPYVQAEVLPLRLEQMEAELASMKGPERAGMEERVRSLRANYKNLGVQVTKTVEDREALPCGAQVIYTPGHTPGHICLYLKEGRTLIAGDALNVTDGLLVASPVRLAWNLEQYKASLIKLAGYDIETVVCYHGGIFNQNVNQRMKEIAKL